MSTLSLTKPELTEKVIESIWDSCGVRVTDTSQTFDEIGMDSLTKVECFIGFERLWDIEIPDTIAERIETVAQAIDHIYDNHCTGGINAV